MELVVRLGLSGPVKRVEMPTATTVKYAAKRAAEAFDLDPEPEEGSWTLVNEASRTLLPEDDAVIGLSTTPCILALRPFAE